MSVAGMLAGAGGAVGAQNASANASEPAIRSCADSGVQVTRGSTIVVQYWTSPNTTPAVSDQLDLVSQHVAEHVRATLGVPPTRLPEGDTLFGGSDVRGPVPVQLVIHRTQPTTWHSDSVIAAGRAKVAAVYLAAFKSMSPDDLWIVWPQGFDADSIVMQFVLMPRQDMIDSDRRSAFGVFRAQTTLLPETAPEVDRAVEPLYPPDAKRNKIAGTVLLRFVVDTTGRVIPSTVTSVTPMPGTFDFPDGMRYYGEFVDAARAAVIATTYRPARLGVCLVPRFTVAPYYFPPGK